MPLNVAIFIDLATRDGRKAVEVREAIIHPDYFIASPKKTIYSCAYESEAGRNLAVRRACEYIKESNIVTIESREGNRAYWQ